MLSTVGVCVYVDENGKVVANSGDEDNDTPEQLRATLRIIQENENGLLLETADAFAGYAASMFIINVQKRLQVARLPRDCNHLLTELHPRHSFSMLASHLRASPKLN